MALWGPLFIKFLFILGNFFLNQNDVEFDLSIGHALVLFLFFFNNKKNVQWTMYVPPPLSKYIYIDIFWT